MEKARLIYLVDRYTANTISKPEYAELMDYIRTEQDEKLFAEIMDGYWRSVEQNAAAEYSLPDLLYGDPAGRGPFGQKTQGRRWKKRTMWLPLLAASVLFFILVRLLFLPPKDASPRFAIKEIVAPADSSVKLTLPDGTMVWLNACSKLNYTVPFNEKTRAVTLEGEAYFDVFRVSDRPFVIHTGNVKTQVLGTAFNINAYRGNDVVVTVTRGRVRVSDHRRQLADLVPNKQLRYNRVNGEASQAEVGADELIAWTEGELRLNNVTMEEAGQTIGRWYNVEVEFDNERIRHCRFTASFLNNEKLPKVLQVICELNGFQYKIENRKVVLHGKGC